MMIELTERFTDVTYRLMLVKSSKGDTPGRASLFRGQSVNKLFDGINTERYTIMFQKIFKITSHNVGSNSSGITQDTIPIGLYSASPTAGRTTRIIRVYIPGSKFGKEKTIPQSVHRVNARRFSIEREVLLTGRAVDTARPTP
jgi:hypothetical protein